jgi:predicted nuclease with TOPRIM domain
VYKGQQGVPTVHLSLPESIYNELKQYAQETGTSITDLIKFMIVEGLEKVRKERMERARRMKEEQLTEKLIQILSELEDLKRRLDEQQAFVEGELYRINHSIQSLRKRVSKLEDMVEERMYPVETELISP